MHKANLGFRFLLEMAMLAAFAVAPALALESGARWVMVGIFPLGAVALWGVFATPDDPSRSGSTVVRTPGLVRLLLEWGLFAGAVGLLLRADQPLYAIALAIGVVIHYSAWPARIRWMIKN